jgi:hypothetical protein
MVAGHKIDGAPLEALVADAGIIIAHNACFDRKFAERTVGSCSTGPGGGRLPGGARTNYWFGLRVSVLL